MTQGGKIFLFGARSVGKTSMAMMYVENLFVESHYPTIVNEFMKVQAHNEQEYILEIIDPAGQDEFSVLNEEQLIGMHGFLLVYSVAQRHSFDILKMIRDKISSAIDNNEVPFVLVGNKCDLQPRMVSFKEGEELAQELGCRFLETSSKNHIDIEKAFVTLLVSIEAAKNQSNKGEKRCILT